MLKRDGCRCHICEQIVPVTELHFDHIIPLHGGSHVFTNFIAVSHAACNLRKGKRLMEDLFAHNPEDTMSTLTDKQLTVPELWAEYHAVCQAAKGRPLRQSKTTGLP